VTPLKSLLLLSHFVEIDIPNGDGYLNDEII
jgi:hypothetical protein